MASVGIGLIGTGGRLRGVLRGVLKQSQDLKVVAAYDPMDASIASLEEQLGYDVTVCPDFESVVSNPDVAFVMIGSWNCFHRDHAVAAMKAGKPLFCEKPLATTMDDALDMARTQKETGLDMTIGFTLRYSPFYRKLKELLASGAIGDLISMEFNETLGPNHGGYIHQDWRRKREWAGTHLLEKCCHDVDLTNWMVGSRAMRVASFGGCNFFKPENEYHIERIGPNAEGTRAFCGWPHRGDVKSPFTADKDIVDNQVAIIEFENGVRASFHTNCSTAITERRMYLCGSEGTIRADVITGKIELQRIGWDTEREIVDPGASGGHGGGDEVLAGEVAASILRGEAPSSTLRDGLNAAVTCFGIDQAMDEGRVVDMRPLWEQVDAIGL